MLDRRTPYPGPEEEHRHPEPEEPETLQAGEGIRGAVGGGDWDDRSERKEAMEGLQMLSSSLAPEPHGRHTDGCGEGLACGAGCHPVGLLDEGRERGEGWFCAGRWPITAEGRLIEDSLAHPAEPAVERGEVRFPGSDFYLDGGSVAGPAEVLFLVPLDERYGVLLPGQQVSREHSPARAASAAFGYGNEDRAGRGAGEDRRPLDRFLRENQGLLAACIARDLIEQGLHPAVIFMVDGFQQLGMVDGQHVRQRVRRLRWIS